MKIFYIDIDEFKKQKSKDFLEQYNDMKLKNEKRFFEYTVGRYLVKKVAKSIYKLTDTEIILNENSKPVFKAGELHFNISHSKNIIVACFDDFPCGVDIEYNKNRCLARFSRYYEKDFKDLEEFYRFWTLKEATYKLGQKPKDTYFSRFMEEFYLTVVSANELNGIEIEKFDS